MGHELRAPMSSVIGMTELALRTQLTPEGRAFLETVRTSADALMETISHVLDLADMGSGGLHLDVKLFSVRDVIEGTLNELRGAADVKGLALSMDIVARLPDAVVGDPVRFGLVVKTLVGNAIKFTKSGEIKIRAELAERRAGELRVRVSISDTGIGIPEEALSRIFEAFSQEDNSPTRGYGGAGLGLTIASQLVALMKGSLEIESTVNVGTTLVFTVSLEPVMADDGFLMLSSHAGRSEG
jgi:signal transduction histidine kinase